MCDHEREVRQLLGAVDERTKSIKEDVVAIKGHQITQNARTDKLEIWMQRILGGAALAALGSPLFIFEIRQSIAGLFGG